MCGRVTIRTLSGAIFDAFPITDYHFHDWRPRYNVAPGDSLPAILRDKDKPALRFLKWGLVPWWAKEDKSIGYKMINARVETVATKAAYRDAFERRRCLIVIDGWYEWQRQGKTKVPYFLHYPDDKPFALAGLWEKTDTCTILTTFASPRLRAIHDREPLIVPQAHWSHWLTAEDPSHEVGEIVDSRPWDGIETRVVSSLVNSPANDLPECVESAAE
jgi:putative SOS response-associated peptidase YedK